jgi:hypothetical protein
LTSGNTINYSAVLWGIATVYHNTPVYQYCMQNVPRYWGSFWGHTFQVEGQNHNSLGMGSSLLSQEKQTGDQFDAESSFAVLYGREDWH